MPVCETVTLLGALSAAISGPEIVRSMVGSLIGDSTSAAAKRFSQSLYSLATGAQSENTLNAMHDCFVGSMQAMSKACESAGGDAQDYFAREAFRKFSNWKAFGKAPMQDAGRLVPLLDQQVRSIFGQQGLDARAIATDQVIAAVEEAIGCALTPALRTVFHDGSGAIGGWAFEFETRFSKKLEAKEVFNVLVVDRLNEILTTVSRVEDNVLEAIQRDKVKHFLQAWHNKTLTAEEWDMVNVLIAANVVSEAGASQAQIAGTAVTVQSLAMSNDPIRRDVADLAKAGAGREAAAQLANAIVARKAVQDIQDAEAYREAARLAVPFSVADAIRYLAKAAELNPDDFWTLIEISRLQQMANSLPKAGEAARQALSQAQTSRERAVALTQIGDIQEQRGDLVGALDAYGEASKINYNLVEDDPSDVKAHRDLSISLTRVGDTLATCGDLAGALAVYEEGLAISRKLANLNYSDHQEGVWVGLNKIGYILKDRGDLAGALAVFEEGLAISRKRATDDPRYAEAQRDHSISLTNVGDILKTYGNLAGARAAYEQGLAIAHKRAKDDPSSAGAQRDLSISLVKFGDILEQNGDLADALKAYKEGLAIARKLATDDPSSAAAQRDVSVCLQRVGDILEQNGDQVGALANYKEGLAIRRTLEKHNPGSAEAQRDLSSALFNVGDILERRGDLAGSLEAYQEGLAIRRTLTKRDPSSAVAQRDVLVCLQSVGDILEQKGDLVSALATYKEGLAIARRLAKDSPNSAIAQRDLLMSLWRMADICAKGHSWAEVKAHWIAMRARGLIAPIDEKLAADIDQRLAKGPA